MQYFLFIILLVVPFLTSYSQSKDYIITVEKDTLNDIKIRSNPFYSNKYKITLKNGTVYEPSEILAYADNDKYYFSVKVNDKSVLVNRLNIGPFRIYNGRNSDGTWTTYFFSKESNQFSELDGNNLDKEIKSRLSKYEEFERQNQKGNVKTIKSPFQGATFLSEYNALLSPDKYVQAKFKRPDELGFKYGFNSKIISLSNNSESKYSFAFEPSVGIRVDFTLIALDLDFKYLQTSTDLERTEIMIKSLIVPLNLEIPIWKNINHSIFISGGYSFVMFDNSSVLEELILSTQNTFVSNNDAKLSSALNLSFKYIYKTKKNKRVEIFYEYLNSSLEVDEEDDLLSGMITLAFDYNSHTLGIALNSILY